MDHTFVVQNTTQSAIVLSDIGQTIPASEEIDLALLFPFDVLHTSASLNAALTSGDLIRLDHLGGSQVESGLEINEYVEQKLVPIEGDRIILEDSADNFEVRISSIRSILSTGIAEFDNGSQAGSSWTLDWTNGPYQKVTLTGTISSLTITPSTACVSLVLTIVQDGTGTHTITWPSSVLWPGGSPPTITGANTTHLIRMYYNGTNYLSEGLTNFS